MTEEMNVRLKDLATGQILNPATKAAVVTNNAGQTLGGVEAGAQVNVIEAIEINGQAMAITGKKASFTLPSASTYTFEKQETPDDGFAATYFLSKDGTQVGSKLNLAKDMFVQSGSLKFAEAANQPLEGMKKGDAYIDLILANSEDQHVYIPANTLVDTYTQGTGIVINDYVIAIDDTVVVTHTDLATELANYQLKLTDAQLTVLASGITAAKVNSYDDHLADTNVHVTTQEKAAWSAKQDALSAEQLANIAAVPDKANSADVYAKTETYSKAEINALGLVGYEEIIAG